MQSEELNKKRNDANNQQLASLFAQVSQDKQIPKSFEEILRSFGEAKRKFNAELPKLPEGWDDYDSSLTKHKLKIEAPVAPLPFKEDEPVRGLRYNTGKTLYNLIPPYPLEQIAKVFTRGAQKYAPHNWRKGMPWSEVEGSLMRHLEAYRAGEDFDEESGLYHMAHVAVNAIFLIDYYRSNPKFDDRLKSYLTLPKIVLDIDEVVCGWAEGYKLYTGKDIQSTYWDSRYGFSVELSELAKGKRFWINLPCIRKPDFVPHAYVSSRSIPVEWTQEWLEKNQLPCRPVYHVPFDASKIEILKSIGTEYFVDDRFENFTEATKAGVCTFLMDATHNQHYNVGYRRIKDLKLKNIIR
jgi:hypothetical protein